MNHTFITLTFFILMGIITLSTSSPEVHSRQELKQRNITQELQKVIDKGCLDLPPKQNFKTSRYFRGEWYLNRFYVLNIPRKDEIKSLCARKDYEFSLVGAFQYIDLHGVEYTFLIIFIIFWIGKYMYYRTCLYIFHCLLDCLNEEKLVFTDRVESFKVVVTVIATGNDHILLYRCVTAGTLTEDNVFVLYNRKNPSDREITAILTPHGMSLDKFISRNNASCTELQERKERERLEFLKKLKIISK